MMTIQVEEVTTTKMFDQQKERNHLRIKDEVMITVETYKNMKIEES